MTIAIEVLKATGVGDKKIQAIQDITKSKVPLATLMPSAPLNHEITPDDGGTHGA